MFDLGLVGVIIELETEPNNKNLANVPNFGDVIKYLENAGLKAYFYRQVSPATGPYKELHQFTADTKEINSNLFLYDGEKSNLAPDVNKISPICGNLPNLYLFGKTIGLEMPEIDEGVQPNLRLINERQYDWELIRSSIKKIITGEITLEKAIESYKLIDH